MGDQSISSLSYGQLVNALTEFGRFGVTARHLRRIGQDEHFRNKVVAAILAADRSLEDCITQHHLSMLAGESRTSLYEAILDRYGQGWYLLKKELITALSEDGNPPPPEQLFFESEMVSIFLMPLWERMTIKEVMSELELRGLRPANADEAILYTYRLGIQSYQYRSVYVPGARVKLPDGKVEMLYVNDGIRLWEWPEIPRDSYVMAALKKAD